MRDNFHTELDRTIDVLLAAGDVTIEMLVRALTALTNHDLGMAEEVLRRDDEVDAAYADVQDTACRLLALQAPVGSDMRLVASLFHVNIHIERMGDYATDIAKLVKLAHPFPDAPDLAQQLREMADHAVRVARAALRSYARRDVELAHTLPDLDDRVDQLNIGVFHRLVKLAAEDEAKLDWATRMILAARHIERWSDHAVDIGEQVVFVVTGHAEELGHRTPTPATTS